MFRFRVRVRCASWVAVLAMLFAALAPAVSHALESARGVSWVEICGAQGPKRILIDERGEPVAPAALHVAEHCAYCSVHAPDLAPLPAPVAVQPGPERRLLPVPPAATPLPAEPGWPDAHPRAPPFTV